MDTFLKLGLLTLILFQFVIDLLNTYSTPYEISDIAETSQGDIAIVEKDGTRAAIITKHGQNVTNLIIPSVGHLWGVARKDSVLFITEEMVRVIHVINENGTYIKRMDSGLIHQHDIDISDNILWITTNGNGVYKLTINENYDRVSLEQFVPNSLKFNLPIGLTIQGYNVVVVCYDSHNVHTYDMTSSDLVYSMGGYGSAGGQLTYPQDVVVDSAGKMYVADVGNNRVVLFSETGQFISNLLTREDGLEGRPVALEIIGNIIYVASQSPEKMHVVQLNVVLFPN